MDRGLVEKESWDSGSLNAGGGGEGGLEQDTHSLTELGGWMAAQQGSTQSK